MRPARALKLLGVSLIALTLADAAAAEPLAPRGGAVVRGAARIVSGTERTVIRQATRRAVIDWRRFDVGRDHTVVFDQPSRSSATLNRVTSARPSVIEGAIRAKGTVVIQNGAGVLFSEGATVDAGALVATSRAVDAARFQTEGRLELGGAHPGGVVSNRGTITVGAAGLAALVGDTVENAGAIVAREGAVMLGGGTSGTIDLAGDGILRIAGKGRVASTGSIDARNVVLSVSEAASVLDAAINVDGLVRTRNGEDGGSIEVHAGSGKARVAGTLDASGRRNGGKVTLTGRQIEVRETARLAARGEAAGGIVRVGGNRGGSGTLPRAREVSIATGAEIAADATTGTGGVIIAWSDGNAVVDGHLSATGGERGGFIETSAIAAIKLGPNAVIAAGDGGRWLLDPRNVVIGTAGAAAGGGTITPPPGTSAYTVSLVALQAALDAGTDVTVTTVQPASTQAGDITVNGALSWTGAGALTLSAERDVLIAAPVTTRDGDFTVSAARSVAVAADAVATGAADIRLSAGTGDIRLSRSRAGDLAVRTAAGDLTLAAGGQVTLRNWYGGLDVATGSGDLAITAGGAILARGGAGANQWVRVGSTASRGRVGLAAPHVDVVGGIGAGSPAEIVAGPGGALAVKADDRILVQDWSGGSRARLASLGGAPLTLEAAMQCWFGTVQSGTGAADGGPVSLAGAIAATVEPIFSLAAGNDFALAPKTPAGVASSYEAALPLAVTTTGGGALAVDAPVKTSRLTLVSEEAVRLGANATLGSSDPGDSLVVSAGRRFENASGSDVFAPGGRWLLYMDAFASPTGTLPVPAGFDLYGRTLAGAPPASLGVPGSRIVYAERPTLTLTADSAGKTYGETVPAIGYRAQGLRAGDSFATALTGAPTLSAGGTAAAAPAGSYATSVAATASAQGYRLVLVDGSVTVARAPLTVAIDDASRRYGAATPGLTAGYSGFVLGEGPGDLAGTLTLASAAPAADVGSYPIAGSGLASGNYAISYLPGTLTVTKAPLTITATDATRRYGAANPVLAASYSGLVAGDTAASLGPLSLATVATAQSNVGSYAITASGLASGNYDVSYAPGTLSVTKAPLTVTARDATRRYGALNPALAASYGGLVAGDTAASLGPLSLATVATAQSNVGSYAITASGLTTGNYDVTYAPGTLSVTKAPLTVTARDATRRYGAANPVLAASYGGLVAGDTAASLGPLSLVTAATAQSNVGSYAITASGLTTGNYDVTYAPGTLSVTKAPLTVTAADATRRYGAGNPAFGVRYAGFVAGDDASDLGGRPALTTTATPATGVGAYPIAASGLSSGNYAIAWRPGTLTINPAPLTIAATDSTRSYGSAGAGYGATYTGFVNGDDASDLAGTLRFETTASQSSPVGTYGVTPTGYTNGNYAISYIAGYLSVDPAPLTVTANDASRIEGGPDPDFTARYQGFVLGEGTDELGGELAILTDADAESPAGSYALTPEGLMSSNYAITFVDGTLSILPAPLPGAARVIPRGERVVVARGVPPLTPGDASFRTTVAEAPPALGNPFALTYSLGEFLQSAAAGVIPAAADTQVAGTQVADTQATEGFVPAAGGLAAVAPASQSCTGRREAGCSAVRENYWTTRTPL